MGIINKNYNFSHHPHKTQSLFIDYDDQINTLYQNNIKILIRTMYIQEIAQIDGKSKKIKISFKHQDNDNAIASVCIGIYKHIILKLIFIQVYHREILEYACHQTFLCS